MEDCLDKVILLIIDWLTVLGDGWLVSPVASGMDSLIIDGSNDLGLHTDDTVLCCMCDPGDSI